MDREFHKLIRDRKEISVRYDSKTLAIWGYGNPQSCPCLNSSLLQEFHNLHLEIQDYFRHNNMKPKIPIRFFVYASQIPDIYSYGGSLDTLYDMIKNNRKDKLKECASIALKVMHGNFVGYDLPIHTITFVEGDAIGGGFEAALSTQAIVSEEQGFFGLQQMRFNVFSGLGYGFLVRKAGLSQSEKIISSAEIYTAKQLYDMGLIQKLATKGEGKKVIDKYMRQYNRSFNAMQAMHKAKLHYTSYYYSELEYMANLWIETLVSLDPTELAILNKIAETQKEQFNKAIKRLRTKQDRRFDSGPRDFPITDSEGNIIEKDRRHNPDPRKSGK